MFGEREMGIACVAFVSCLCGKDRVCSVLYDSTRIACQGIRTTVTTVSVRTAWWNSSRTVSQQAVAIEMWYNVFQRSARGD